MKKIFFLLIFIAMCISAFAQTGLFGLSYLDGKATCTQKLAKQGFKPSPDDPSKYENDTEYPTMIVLYFSPDDLQLVSWLIIAAPETYGGYDEVEEHFINLLQELHGEDFEYDWDYLEAYWRLDSEHYISSAFDGFMDDYWIFYGNTAYPEITPY